MAARQKNRAKKYMKQNGCKACDVLYIGDEKRDTDVCNKLGVDVIFVRWGFDADEYVSGYRLKAALQTPEKLGEYLLN